MNFFFGMKQKGAGLDLLADFDQLILFIRLFIRHLLNACHVPEEWGHTAGIDSMQTIYSQGFSTLAGDTEQQAGIQQGVLF